MFITVMFGAGCRELVNPRCSPVTLTAHLRQRGRVPPDATIALLAEDGHLVSLGDGLEEGTTQAPSPGSPPLLQERGTYVLVQIIRKWGLRPAPLPLRLGWNAGRGGPPRAMSPCWRTWRSAVQSWPRCCAACRASPRWTTAGGGAPAPEPAPGVATRTQAVRQGPNGALCRGCGLDHPQ
uniref:Uncharacterized protein n=1 Tax=Pipistrellus kuhlii TaxID=59472 RepID=A0A7J7UFF9_PIPKU|nr:hypothetical protein mPipKuh1_001794 [Pipistrellus kuhlii]